MSQVKNKPILSCGDFKRAPFLVVGIVGPPGAGKTSFLEATARQLRGKARVGAITISPAAERDADRLSRYCQHVEAVKAAAPSAMAVESVLPRFPFDDIDILLIESLGGISGVPAFGQDVTITVLSVCGGDDKAAEYARLIHRSAGLVLNKADLLRHVTFDRGTFQADLQRLNPEAKFFEVSTYENRGMDRWISWLDQRHQEKFPGRDKSKVQQAEWFLG